MGGMHAGESRNRKIYESKSNCYQNDAASLRAGGEIGRRIDLGASVKRIEVENIGNMKEDWRKQAIAR